MEPEVITLFNYIIETYECENEFEVNLTEEPHKTIYQFFLNHNPINSEFVQSMDDKEFANLILAIICLVYIITVKKKC